MSEQLPRNINHTVNLTLLKTEVRRMMLMCFWRNSHHWSSSPSRKKKDYPHIILKVAYFKNLNWFGFNFCKFHPDAVEVFRQLPAPERFFYEIVQDRYTSFKVWCIDRKHFETVIAQLNQYKDVELEFVVNHSQTHLLIPKPFIEMGLTFYERGVEAQKQRSTGAQEHRSRENGEKIHKKSQRTRSVSNGF